MRTAAHLGRVSHGPSKPLFESRSEPSPVSIGASGCVSIQMATGTIGTMRLRVRDLCIWGLSTETSIRAGFIPLYGLSKRFNCYLEVTTRPGGSWRSSFHRAIPGFSCFLDEWKTMCIFRYSCIFYTTYLVSKMKSCSNSSRGRFQAIAESAMSGRWLFV